VSDTPRLRPSSFPMWLECPCFESSPISGPAAESGTRQHDALALFLHGDATGAEAVAEITPAELENARWAADQVLEIAKGYHKGPKDLHIEEMVTICDQDLEQVSRGKIDVGFDRAIVDYKGGEVRNYRPQMYAYAAAWAQAYGLALVDVFEVYGRYHQVKKYTVTVAEATETVFQVKAEVENPNKKPAASGYCSWCAKAATCPALLMPATAFYTKVDVGDANQVLALAGVDIDEASPEDLSKMQQVADVLSQWTKAIDEKVKAELASGADIPGYMVKRSKGNQRIADTAKALEAAGLPVETFLACCSASVSKLSDAVAKAADLKKKDGRPELERRLGELIKRGRDRIEVVPAKPAVEDKGAE